MTRLLRLAMMVSLVALAARPVTLAHAQEGVFPLPAPLYILTSQHDLIYVDPANGGQTVISSPGQPVADFDIAVAAYPETHREARSPQADLDHLKRKLDAGASRAITQFFCAPETFLRFVERARAAGIDAEIVPGILPITNFKSFEGFAARCAVDIPRSFATRFEGLDDDPETRRLIAAAVAIEQCNALREAGVDKFHFYTLNRPELTRAICHALGLRADDTQSPRLAEETRATV